jgi:hypothetical protein
VVTIHNIIELDGELDRKMKQETSMKQAIKIFSFMLVSCLSYSSTLRAEATYFSET